MKLSLSILILFSAVYSSAQKQNFLLAGTYTKGKSVGIYVYDFNSREGSLKPVDSISSVNPSYLAVSPNQKFVYAVSETTKGKVRSFSFDKKTGHLSFLNEQSSGGDNPCYITVDKTGQWAIVGNYSSGTLAVLAINKDGSLGEAVSSAKHEGSGVNKQRQASPHVHSTVLSPDNKFLFVPDLGVDKIMIYSFDEITGKISPAKDSAAKLQDGSGPRHFDFHPNKKTAYLVQEMAGTVTVFDYDKGSLKAVQTIRTVPEEFHQSYTGADIHVSPDGKFLYSSNRDSSNTIAVFKIDQKTGKLNFITNQSTLGRTPRNFTLHPSGNFLIAANQNSDSIVVFKKDRKTGLLTDTGHGISVGNPVCLKWIEK